MFQATRSPAITLTANGAPPYPTNGPPKRPVPSRTQVRLMSVTHDTGALIAADRSERRT